MIARVWRGWASRSNADAYEAFLRTAFLPALGRIRGYQGAQVFRRDEGDEVEFMTSTYFETLDAVRAFAGTDYEMANVAPEARRLLSRFDQRCKHYDVALTLAGFAAGGARPEA